MQQYLNRFVLKLPHWFRWILILPVAFLADLIAQIIYRLGFWIIPFSSIHPYTDELAWLCAPDLRRSWNEDGSSSLVDRRMCFDRF
jgi:hypothetical protein